ncbi:unnamed protein product [Closterium sp. NIES-54]
MRSGNGAATGPATRALRRISSRMNSSSADVAMKPLSLRKTVVGDSGFLPNQLAGDPSGGEMRAMEQLELERGVCNPFKKYTPEMVRARAFSSPSAFLGILLRGTEIVWELTMFFLSLSYDKLVGLDERNVPTRAAQLRRLLCRLGPSFIKSGQVLANRPDIIREDYMNELCILQDDVPAFPTQLRRLLCRLGPSFIKSGQVLANRPDIIREDYMNELCILQDDVPAFPTQVRQPSLRRPQVKRCCKAACRHACKLLCCPP